MKFGGGIPRTMMRQMCAGRDKQKCCWKEHLKSLDTECKGSGPASEGTGWLVKAIKGRQGEYMEKDGENYVLAILHGNLRTACLWRCSNLE